MFDCSNMRLFEGDYTQVDANYAIIVSRFNGFIVEHLLAGAVDALVRQGVTEKNIQIVRVPGAYELPVACGQVMKRPDVDAGIALGAVVRGSTAHFDYVAGECAKGVAQVGVQVGKPLAFGVITTDTLEQAIERAGTKAGNKGAEAAYSAMEMVSLFKRLSAP